MERKVSSERGRAGYRPYPRRREELLAIYVSLIRARYGEGETSERLITHAVEYWAAFDEVARRLFPDVIDDV